jgi:hypothetical protein
MKKLLPLWLLMVVTGSLMAQYCGFPAGTPDTNFTGIISSYNNFSCVKRGVPFNNSFDIRVPSQYSALGNTFPVVSVLIDSVTNMPCNLCWSTDQLNAWNTNEVHCINIQGTTVDSVGLYKLSIYANATILFNGVQETFPGTLDLIGAQFYVRVIDSNGVCPAVIVQPGDTSNTRIACGTAPATPCPTVIPINITSVTGSPCNYSQLTYTLPAGYTNPVWTFFDSAYYLSDSNMVALSTSFGNGSYSGSFNSLQATDSTGCHIYMPYIASTNTGAYLEPHICIATLDSGLGHNVVVWHRDYDNYDATISRFNLYSSIDDSMPHPSTLLGSVGFDSLTTFIDTVNIPLSGVIKYELRMQDTCGTEITAHNVFAPPLLGIDTANGVATLTWNFISAFDINLFSETTTRLWRSTDSISWTQIAVGASNIDSGIYGLSRIRITDTMPVNGYVVYMVEILMPASCSPSVARSQQDYISVYSNRVTPGTKAPVIINAVQSIAGNGRLNIYPNPGNDFITINTSGVNGTINNLLVYDITGRQVLGLYQAAPGSNFTQHINVGSLTAGTYIIRLETSDGNFSNIWVKE